METKAPAKIQVIFTYFKPSGKYYAEGSINLEAADARNLTSVVKFCSAAGNNLPGLSSSRWVGTILATAPDHPPHIIQCSGHRELAEERRCHEATISSLEFQLSSGLELARRIKKEVKERATGT